MNTKAIPHIHSYHPCTSSLIDKLKDGKPGDTLTNAQLSTIAGANIEEKTGYLYSAIRYCTANHKVLWQRVRGQEKIVCLNDTEILAASKGDVKRVRKLASRGQRKLYIVDQSQLTEEQIRDFRSTVVQLGVFKLFGSKGMKDKLIEDGSKSLPKISDLRKVFR